MRRRTPWPQAPGPRTFDWARIQSGIATAAAALSSPAPTSTSRLPDERSNPRGHFAQEKELGQQMKADQKQECQEQKQRQRPGCKTRAGASWRRWPWRANPLSPSRPWLPWGIAKTMPDPSRAVITFEHSGEADSEERDGLRDQEEAYYADILAAGSQYRLCKLMMQA
ncbi:unnamed protein product [Rangifer tarandus platyrhynchus]|uniref:Uncharacterized protein n=1 Tax=Rangifer tarandus platyrhynchus TaxID=3082113 RepID=A0AC59Z407_RANTA